MQNEEIKEQLEALREKAQAMCACGININRLVTLLPIYEYSELIFGTEIRVCDRDKRMYAVGYLSSDDLEKLRAVINSIMRMRKRAKELKLKLSPPR